MSANLYLYAERVSAAYGDRVLFHLDQLRIFEGDRIGLVGMNGSGKTTLLHLLSGELQPESGVIRRFCVPFYFQQFPARRPVRATPEALRRMGVQGLHGQSSVSGGEAIRLRLAEMFSQERAFLLLDEPTCSLDQEGIRYLDERLRDISTLMIVSHDRSLLNRQCSRILEIEQGRVTAYDGNYDAYALQKQQAKARAQAEYEQYTDEMNRLKLAYAGKKDQARQAMKKPRKISGSDAKGREFSASHRSPGSKAKMLERSAQSIRQRMEHMPVKERPRNPPVIQPDFRLTDPPQNKTILQAEHLYFSYPNGKEIFRDAGFHLSRNSRAALLGPNGSGKTTLLRLIQSGDLAKAPPKARLGFFRQDLSDLEADKSVLQNAMSTSVQKEAVVRGVLARLLFSARDLSKPARVLSGGERIRLSFAKLFVSAANVLIFDEPTNYLDIPSAEALEQMFAAYEGTMLFASHDEAFIRAVATERWLIRDHKILSLPMQP